MAFQLFCYDYRFLKANRFQPRHPIKALRTAALKIGIASLWAFDTTLLRFVRTILHSALAGHLNYSHLIDFEYNMRQDRTYPYLEQFLLLVYSVECLVSFFSLVLPRTEGLIDLDLIFVISLISACSLFSRLVSWKTRAMVGQSGDRDSQHKELLVEYLLHAISAQSTNPRAQLDLASCIAYHQHSCADPSCSCFLASLYVDPNGGPGDIRRRGKSLNAFLEGKDAENTEVLRQFANPVLAGKWERFVEVQQLPEETRSWLLANRARRGEAQAVLNYQSERLMKAVVGGFVGGDKDGFRLFQRRLAYHLFELENCLFSLVSIYQYIHSKEFKKKEEIQRTIILHNLFKMTKDATDRQHKEQQSDADTNLLDLSKVLSYHQTLDELRTENKQLIKEKKKFYEELSQPRIELTKLLDLGNNLQGRILESGRKFELLFDCHRRNLNIVEAFAYFEGFVLQMEQSSERVRISLKEIVLMKEEHFRRSYVRPSDMYYDHENSVIFTRQKKTAFEIIFFSSNTPELFEVKEDRLRNGLLSDYIPSPIDEHHDKILSQYLHGVSRRKSTTFKTYLKTAGKFV